MVVQAWPNALKQALASVRQHLQCCLYAYTADYIGCMKTGQIMTSPEWRWFEPQHAVLGSKDYFTHAWGSIYVLSGSAASSIAQMTSKLRYFANEGNYRCRVVLESPIFALESGGHAASQTMENTYRACSHTLLQGPEYLTWYYLRSGSTHTCC